MFFSLYSSTGFEIDAEIPSNNAMVCVALHGKAKDRPLGGGHKLVHTTLWKAAGRLRV